MYLRKYKINSIFIRFEILETHSFIALEFLFTQRHYTSMLAVYEEKNTIKMKLSTTYVINYSLKYLNYRHLVCC